MRLPPLASTIASVFAAAWLAWPAVAAAATTRHVVLLYSYEREFAPHQSFGELFRADLVRAYPESVDFVELSLKSARTAGEPADQSTVDNLRSQLSGASVDLVVTIGGPAAQFAQRFRADLFPSAPVLMAAVDDRFIDHARFGETDTYVAATHDLRAALQNVVRLLPDTTTVLVVLGTSQLEQFWTKEAKQAFEPFTGRLHFVWSNGMTYEQLLKTAATLPPHSAIFYGMLTLDAAGAPQTEAQTLTALHATASAPLFGTHSSQIGRGIVGGPVLSVETLSHRSVDVALQLLRGVTPGSIRTPVLLPEPLFDWRELRRWKVPEARLPPGAVVRFRDPPAAFGNRSLIWIGAAGTALVLIAALFVTGKGRSSGRPDSHQPTPLPHGERFESSNDTTGVGMWVAGIEGRRLDAPQVHPADVAQALAASRTAAAERAPFQIPYRVAAGEGTYRQVLDIGVPRYVGTTFAGYVGATVDLDRLTPDDRALSTLSRRLMQIQEQHHASLAARHQDISQRMMSLTLRLHGVAAAGDAAAVRGTVQELCTQLSELAAEIQNIPDPLYRKLDLLGFATAAGTLCRDLSARHQFDVGFRSTGAPPDLREDVSVALLRVIEEAVNHAATHAGTTEVTVSVAFRGDEIHLEIADDGVEVDLAERQRVELLSMRERLRMVEGDCNVEARADGGSRVLARVPV